MADQAGGYGYGGKGGLIPMTVDTGEAAPAADDSQLITSKAVDRDKGTTVKIIAGNDLTTASADAGVSNVLVSVVPPEDGERQPCDITCIIDTSGSMGVEAKIQSAGGTTESHGLSLLDVAKHGVKTIIKMLGKRDRLSMVSFCHEANTILALTAMDESGQELAIEKLEELRAAGGTDLWQGLVHGLDALRTGAETGRFGHVMILTDGESREADKIVPNLQQYKEQHERLPGTINTFAFGYKLDSRLLVKLATEGSGTYSFIPDAGFVGTAFVNSLANILVTMAREAYLTLELDSGAELALATPENPLLPSMISGGFPVVKKGEYYSVNLGTLQYGQSKDVVVPMRIKDPSGPFLVANVQYETRCGGAGSQCTLNEGVEASAANMTGDALNMALVEGHRCRTLFAQAIYDSVLAGGPAVAQGRQEQAKALIAEAVDQVKKSPACSSEEVVKLLEDMCGQSTEAVSTQEFWAKWGIHYMPSVMFAHRLQQCNNFKDPGVQVYGGKLFGDLRDDADDVFNSLPAPKPSAPRRASQPASAPVSMAAYNDRFCG